MMYLQHNPSVVRAAFLFKAGRSERLHQVNAVMPTEFFYGYNQMKAAGHSVVAIDECELELGITPSILWRLAIRLAEPVIGCNIWAAWQLYHHRRRFHGCDVIVATTNAFGLAAAFLRRIGALRLAVVFIAMGLISDAHSPRHRKTREKLLTHVHTALISRSELAQLEAWLPKRVALRYVPFGVDHRYWTPGGASVGDDGYVLSVGNDRHRDYETLLHAWRPEFPRLKVVTGLPVGAHPANVEVIAGDWRRQLLSDAALRDLVRGCRFVVLPIRDTWQPSGQSACLQAMACGKAVVLSDIRGLWDRDLMRHDQTCVLVPPGDASALAVAIEYLLQAPDHAARIGAAARQVVERHLNVYAMAAAMAALCREAAVGGRQ